MTILRKSLTGGGDMQKIKVVKASERVERSKPVRTVERVRTWVDEARREIQLRREAQSRAFFA